MALQLAAVLLVVGPCPRHPQGMCKQLLQPQTACHTFPMAGALGTGTAAILAVFCPLWAAGMPVALVLAENGRPRPSKANRRWGFSDCLFLKGPFCLGHAKAGMPTWRGWFASPMACPPFVGHTELRPKPCNLAQARNLLGWLLAPWCGDDATVQHAPLQQWAAIGPSNLAPC